jgi:hypothetical protein
VLSLKRRFIKSYFILNICRKSHFLGFFPQNRSTWNKKFFLFCEKERKRLRRNLSSAHILFCLIRINLHSYNSASVCFLYQASEDNFISSAHPHKNRDSLNITQKLYISLCYYCVPCLLSLTHFSHTLCVTVHEHFHFPFYTTLSYNHTQP